MPVRSLATVILVLLALAGCSTFRLLTDISNQENRGPKAEACAECHSVQYGEWQSSPHATAYTNPAFQKAFNDGGDSECLTCHAPIGIREDGPQARTFNLTSGVDCVSCHYSMGKMHGPHPSSALFQPHQIEGNDQFYLTNEFCGRCHNETVAEQPVEVSNSAKMLCLSCHAAPERRTASQGNGVFSNALVAFENVVPSHSHAIRLAGINSSAMAVTLAFSVQQNRLTLINDLPHNLPTGTYGDKTIDLQIHFLRGERELASQTIRFCDASHPLTPHQQKTVEITWQKTAVQPDTLLVTLVRTDDGGGFREPVTLLQKQIQLSSQQP
jgi:predicted CXXCH cytochrome family protein